MTRVEFLARKLHHSPLLKQAFYPQPGYYLAPTAAAAAPFHPAAAGSQVALPGAHPAAAAASYYYGGYSAAAYPYAAAGRLVSSAPVLALGV